MSASQFPEPVTVTLHGKRDVVNVTQLRTLRWGDYPALSRQAGCHHRCPYKAAEGSESRRENMGTETEGEIVT